jgi:alkyl hydroperoxide reductase 1
MAAIKVGDTVPTGKFATVYYTPELDNHAACGVRE